MANASALKFTPRPPPARKRTSIIVDEDVYGRAQRLTSFWNAARPGRARWTVTSVLRHLVEQGLNGAWQEVGGEPSTEAQWVAAVARVRKAK